jgi:hypothetical protein
LQFSQLAKYAVADFEDAILRQSIVNLHGAKPSGAEATRPFFFGIWSSGWLESVAHSQNTYAFARIPAISIVKVIETNESPASETTETPQLARSHFFSPNNTKQPPKPQPTPKQNSPQTQLPIFSRQTG